MRTLFFAAFFMSLFATLALAGGNANVAAGVPVVAMNAAGVVGDIGMIARLIDMVKWLYDNAFPLIGAVVVMLNSAAAVFLLVPGDQPEKAIKAVADFLAKFSRK